ncbi:MAG: cell division protein ZapB [Thermodesulfovibrionales bacterium]
MKYPITFVILNSMGKNKSLFDDANPPSPAATRGARREVSSKKEGTPLERLKNLEDKIADAIEKVKTLKEEKTALEKTIKQLEARLDAQGQEIEKLQTEKTSIKNQVERLLNEVDTLEVV